MASERLCCFVGGLFCTAVAWRRLRRQTSPHGVQGLRDVDCSGWAIVSPVEGLAHVMALAIAIIVCL